MSSNTSNTHHIPADDEIDLTELFHSIWFYKWYILLVTAIFSIGGFIYVQTATPVYQADAMVEISNGKNQVLGNLSELFSGSPANTPVDTEVQLIKSRLILGKTIEELNLDTVVVPQTSILNKLLSGSREQPSLDIGSFAVAPQLQNQNFTFTAQGPEEYRLVTPEGQTYNGRVGQVLSVKGLFSLSVKQIRAPFGQKFSLTKFSPNTSFERLNQSLTVAGKGKNIPVIGLTLSGSNPELIERTLNSIIKNYITQNRDKDIQTAANGLKFISEELPRLHEELQAAEDRLNLYRSRNKSLDVPSEAKGTLESLNKIEMQIVDLKTEESVLSEVYTKDHPAYKSIRDKLKVLNDAKERLNKQIVRMPETQQEIIRLTRNVDINQTIYVQLLAKQQELGILQASSQGSVRLIDSAVTADKPIKPKKAIIMALATVVGLFLSIGFFLMKSLFHKGISSEEEVEAIGTDILGSIPKSEVQAKQDEALKKTRKGKDGVRSTYLLSMKAPTDIAVEALRALRTNLYFTSLDSANKIIMVSGATPEVGKSFISANLAVLMAQSGKKVLLIDADMRKGYLHHLFSDIKNEKGLPDILWEGKPGTYHKLIQKTNVHDLHFVSRGKQVRNPSELLLSDVLPEFLAWADKQYDYIVLDTPPVLAVTDAAVIGQYAGLSLLVSRFGHTAVDELEESITRFNHSNIKVSGVVLNGIERTAKNAYKKYHYYGYTDNNAAKSDT